MMMKINSGFNVNLALLGWVHQFCGGHPDLTCDQLQELFFLFKTCDAEELVTH